MSDFKDIRNFPSILTKTLYEDRAGEYAVELREYLADRSGEDRDAYATA